MLGDLKTPYFRATLSGHGLQALLKGCCADPPGPFHWFLGRGSDGGLEHHWVKSWSRAYPLAQTPQDANSYESTEWQVFKYILVSRKICKIRIDKEQRETAYSLPELQTQTWDSAESKASSDSRSHTRTFMHIPAHQAMPSQFTYLRPGRLLSVWPLLPTCCILDLSMCST